MEKYFNGKGELKEYQCKVDFHNSTLKEVYDHLMASAHEYLMHRYNTILDKVYWGRFLAETALPVIWMDYSVNIKLIEKIKLRVRISVVSNKPDIP